MINEAFLSYYEYTILGGMFHNPSCVGEVMASLKAEDFSEGASRTLFEAFSKLHFSGSPIDLVTVCNEAGEGYAPAIGELMKYTELNVAYHCTELRQNARLMAMQGHALALARADSIESANGIMDKLNGLIVTRQKVEIISAQDAAKAFLERQAKAQAPEYLKWGIDELDKALYVELGDFIVIGGYPSAGKTLLSLQFAERLAKKYRVGYFSLETNPQKLSDRLMAHLSRIPLHHIKKRELDDGEMEAITNGASKLSALKFDSIGAAGMTVRDIQAVTLNKRYDIIFVDYLQLIVANGKNRYEEVTNISKDLHTMAQARGVTVIALAQLSRPEKSAGKPQPPSMSSFRESGQIEQDADVAILLWPEDINDNKSCRVLKVAKNKEGERLRMTLTFDGATQTLIPVTPSISSQINAATAAARKYAEPKQMLLTEVSQPDDDLPF